ncbi:MoxR family ATPase [Paenibacillus polysaccharolyticus]|uniref:MoxR-like ATPase n=2 Tax=Paenibacillus TaxID=44249 RepID=A0A1G5AWQ0_9BACL|nr:MULTISPECIES: MoxR family ATPase [Paenibacillus]MDP9699315.1 MoxR-like ATPase [Paenibacillus intestini]MBY0204248.1 MoxR family ATPase [Paenibacillus cucumis (ex Kampfer et al. 2016)]MCM3133935.1 MoxR family ATPase [Paenibacillus polysaccharolyticus]MCP1132576.1 MoxR family ATPase [Paenibacillus polysaccharolyticus]MDT0124123.1 MoxR family ATPase [Paenibacillus sp. RRE4]
MPVRKESIQIISAVRSNLESCIMGKSFEIQLLLTALLAGGHVLIEDVPGTGKTQLIKALSKSMRGEYRRIQCNPDILPSDITGVSVFHPKDERFYFRPGPVMTNILLADEINRATTKTQSALLEVMEERSVTVDGDTYDLPHPFMLCATQNPIDFEGTYTLPEAQLDRFMLKISLGYPDKDIEKTLLKQHQSGQPVDRLESVTHMDQISAIQQEIKEVFIGDPVMDYLLDVVRHTRTHPSVLLGASPRAAISFMMAVKAFAFLQERDYVLPDDVKTMAPYVISHRIVLRPESRLDSMSSEAVLNAVLQQVRVPVSMGQ